MDLLLKGIEYNEKKDLLKSKKAKKEVSIKELESDIIVESVKLQINIYLEENNIEDLKIYAKEKNIKEYSLYFLVSELNQNKDIGNGTKIQILKKIEEFIKINYKKETYEYNYFKHALLLIDLNLCPYFALKEEEKEELNASYKRKRINFLNLKNQVKKYFSDENNSLYSYIQGIFYYKKFKNVACILFTNQNKENIEKSVLDILNKSQYYFEKSFELFSSTPDNSDTFLTKCNYSIPYLSLIYLFKYNVSKLNIVKYTFLKKAVYFALLSWLDSSIPYGEYILKYIFKSIYYEFQAALNKQLYKFNFYFYWRNMEHIKDEEFKFYVIYFYMNKKNFINNVLLQEILVIRGYCLLYGNYSYEKNEALGERILLQVIDKYNNLIAKKIIEKYKQLKTSQVLISIKKRKMK